MDFDIEFRTVLQDYPGLRAKFLVEKIMKTTQCTRSTVWEHLTSAVNRNVVFREKGHYYLELPEGATRRAKEKHTKEIISGLLVLSEKGKYTAPNDILADPSFAEYALQHLKSGYSSISILESIDKKLFIERVRGLIEALKIGDEKLKGQCEKCKKK